MSYQIPDNLPQPTRFEEDGSPTWVFADGEWTNRGWIVPLDRLAEYIVPQEPPEPVEPVPETITKGQLIRALFRLHGITDDALEGTVNAIIGSMPDGPEKTEANYLWRYSIYVDRPQLLVGIVGMQFGLTDEQIDTVYRLGVTL